MDFSGVGDLMDDEEVLDWLTDPDNMESADHIERVNRKMFERILKRSDFVGVFFCKTCLFTLLTDVLTVKL